jgi:hypothetical protein
MGMVLVMVLALVVLRELSVTGHRYRGACVPAVWHARLVPDRRRTSADRPREQTSEQMLQRLYVDGLLTDAEYEEKLSALFSKGAILIEQPVSRIRGGT